MTTPQMTEVEKIAQIIETHYANGLRKRLTRFEKLANDLVDCVEYRSDGKLYNQPGKNGKWRQSLNELAQLTGKTIPTRHTLEGPVAVAFLESLVQKGGAQ